MSGLRKLYLAGRRLNLYLVGVDDELVERLDIGYRVLSNPVWSRR